MRNFSWPGIEKSNILVMFIRSHPAREGAHELSFDFRETAPAVQIIAGFALIVVIGFFDFLTG
jgi:hypothetical protein